MSILTNQDILNGQPLDATCIEGKMTIVSGLVDQSGETVEIRIRGDEPGVVLDPKRFTDSAFFTEAGRTSLLKRDWHAMFKPDAPAQLLERRDEYFPAENQEGFLAHRRIFGMGSFVFMKLDDGIFCAMVQRQAPKTDETGAVAIGKYSRAAGAADGDLIDCQTWELGEELYALVDRGTHLESIVFRPEPNACNRALMARVEAHKEQRIHEILNDPNLQGHETVKAYQAGKPVQSVQHGYHLLHVGQLARHISVHMPDGSVRTTTGYVHDDARNGDLNIDQVGVVSLPGVTSSQITLFDDEMKAPRRPWHLLTPEALITALQDQTMEFSPAPAQVIRHMPLFLQALQEKLRPQQGHAPEPTPRPA